MLGVNFAGGYRAGCLDILVRHLTNDRPRRPLRVAERVGGQSLA
jgi:hypothetical protein